MYPTISLAPGSTNTTAVKQLQNYLVSQGYMTQAEMNTGPGIYGPRTTAAVQKLQQALGVDNSTGPGYWGPRTLAAVQTAATAPKATTPTTTQQTAPTISPQKAMLAAVSDVAQSASITGKPPVSFAEALELASKDPNIVAKYADMAKLDKQGFLQQIQTMQSLYSTQAQQQKMEFEKDRESLAEQNAAAGTAYSGFRGQAQADLAKTQSGIITSTRAQQQEKLNALTSAFEGKYGTGATPSASLTLENPLAGNVTMGGLDTTGGGTSTLTGQLAGGITGAVAPAQKQDILSSAYQSYQVGQFPQV